MSKNQLAARGSWLAKARPDLAGQQYDGQAVETPAGLSVASAAVFEKIQGKLIELGCWDSVFRFALERYSFLWERWSKTISRDVVFDSDLKKLNTMLSNLEAEFGLTPSDRERLHCTRQEPEDKNKMRFFPKISS